MKNVRCYLECEHNVSGWCHADIIVEVQGAGVLMHYCPVRPDFASPFVDEVDPMLRFDERDLSF